jgi:hypothetical protein
MKLTTMSTALALLAVVGGCKFPELPPIEDDAASADAPVVEHQLTINIDRASTGAGTVVVEPGGFSCATSTCTRSYDAGTDLRITVSGMTALDRATSISGDCSASPCDLLDLDGDRTVTVTFDRLECAPSTESCVGGQYSQCGVDGNYVSHLVPNGGGEGVATTLVMRDYLCPMGCHATAPRCADIDTENGLVASLDSADVSPAGIDLVLPAVGAPSGMIEINTNSFDEVAGEIRFNDTNGATVIVPARLVIQNFPAPTVLALETRTFTLRTGTTIRVGGNRALAIVSHFDVVVGGRLDLSAIRDGEMFGEGPGVMDASASCTGGYLTGVSAGGSCACQGGLGSNGAPRGTNTGNTPTTVAGGCSGGRSSVLFDLGAGAGGGLALVSRTKVTLEGASTIDLSGGGGRGGQNFAYGGGAGGRLVAQAPSLVISPGAVIAGRGGGGGAGGPMTGVTAPEATTAETIPAGITCAGCGTGGVSGSEGTCASSGNGSGTALGGGGGASGLLVSCTRTGITTAPAGTLRIRLAERTLLPRSP